MTATHAETNLPKVGDLCPGCGQLVYDFELSGHAECGQFVYDFNRHDSTRSECNAVPPTRPINGADECREERDSTRIRALLARTRPLSGNEVPEVYWTGRTLIESLALAFDLGAENQQHWNPVQCATVLRFLAVIEPAEGDCFCHDESRVNATCGLHVILDFVAGQLEAPKAKGRKRAAQVAHG